MKKLKKVIIAAVLVLGCGYTYYVSQKSDVELSELTLANIEALAQAESGGNYEYPDGFRVENKCNVSLGGWRKCKVTIVDCQGGGSGCNRSDCPLHPRWH